MFLQIPLTLFLLLAACNCAELVRKTRSPEESEAKSAEKKGSKESSGEGPALGVRFMSKLFAAPKNTPEQHCPQAPWRPPPMCNCDNLPDPGPGRYGANNAAALEDVLNLTPGKDIVLRAIQRIWDNNDQTGQVEAINLEVLKMILHSIMDDITILKVLLALQQEGEIVTFQEKVPGLVVVIRA